MYLHCSLLAADWSLSPAQLLVEHQAVSPLFGRRAVPDGVGCQHTWHSAHSDVLDQSTHIHGIMGGLGCCNRSPQ